MKVTKDHLENLIKEEIEKMQESGELDEFSNPFAGVGTGLGRTFSGMAQNFRRGRVSKKLTNAVQQLVKQNNEMKTTLQQLRQEAAAANVQMPKQMREDIKNLINHMNKSAPLVSTLQKSIAAEASGKAYSQQPTATSNPRPAQTAQTPSTQPTTPQAQAPAAASRPPAKRTAAATQVDRTQTPKKTRSSIPPRDDEQGLDELPTAP